MNSTQITSVLSFLWLLLGRSTLLWKALSFTHERFLIFFFLSIHRAQQRRSGWPLNVFRRFRRKQSFNNWYIEISSTPSLIFTGGGQKVRNLASFKTSFNFEPLAFENAARYPNAETNFLCMNDRPMSSPSLVKLGLRIPENRLSSCPAPRIARRKLLNR